MHVVTEKRQINEIKTVFFSIYSFHFKHMDFDRAKASRINDHKSVNINNMDPFTIVDSRSFFRAQNHMFEVEGVYTPLHYIIIHDRRK